MIGLTLLGSTGSIGASTLEVLALHRDKYCIIALTANSNLNLLAEQCEVWRPEYAVIADADAAELLRSKLISKGIETEVLSGIENLQYVAALPQAQYVVAAIVGAAGLLPTLAAAQKGKRILLANKESLVMSGKLFMDTVIQSDADLLPIDSEHNAVFQCLPKNYRDGLDIAGIDKILLTASGGALRNLPLGNLYSISPEQACEHPNWNMGKKISVDSATMMNKGLELIEACWLFNIAPHKVEIVIHPQSIIHAMVQYTDGSVLAHLGNPDMRVHIAQALAWPERIVSGVKPLNLFEVARLDFEMPDMQRFPCLRLACEAIAAGGTATAIMNAANEVAVEAFLNKQINFGDIAKIVEVVLENISVTVVDSVDTILDADFQARQFSLQYISDSAAVV